MDSAAPPAPPLTRARPREHHEKGKGRWDRIKVGVNGYGVIGKRVADAVHAQPDMQLTGVADIITDWRIRSAARLTPTHGNRTWAAS